MWIIRPVASIIVRQIGVWQIRDRAKSRPHKQNDEEDGANEKKDGYRKRHVMPLWAWPHSRNKLALTIVGEISPSHC